ncbi:MAG: CDP-glycerol glycerophosphotransferase family protein [Clostridia bacterium]|nr:CDP-glycerol glycerophosphotransferase family protein [Clostridia bacterium]
MQKNQFASQKPPQEFANPVVRVYRGFRRIIGWLVGPRLSRFIPVKKNQIIFVTQDDEYCCNPKFICEELLKRPEAKELKIFFTTRGESYSEYPPQVNTVVRGRMKYYLAVFSSKYIVVNSVLFTKVPFTIKKSQVMIQTWHGSLGIKRFGEADYKTSTEWVKAAKYCGAHTNYIISNSTFEDFVYRDTFWKDTPIWQYGHPRNDFFFEQYEQMRKDLRNQFADAFGLPRDRRFVLYAPTFRDSKDLSFYELDVPRLLQALKEKFGGEWTFLFRLHPTMRRLIFETPIYQTDDVNVIDASNYHDMQELMTFADVAITDYSSWIYDYIMLRRPGFIYATDVKDYETERGFYYPLKETPFAIAQNMDELCDAIQAFDDAAYQAEVEAFIAGKGCMDDGQASRRTVDSLLEIMRTNGAFGEITVKSNQE